MKLDRLNAQLDAFREEVAHKWSKLTKADLENVVGDVGTLSGVLAKRYAMTAKDARAQAEQFLSHFGTSIREAAEAVGDAAHSLWRNGRTRVADAFSQGSEKAGDLWQSSRDQVADIHRRAVRVVEQRPLTSIAVALGVGALAAMLFRRR